MITHYCSDCGSTPRVWEDCCSPAQLDYENPQAVIDALREVDAALTLALKERDAYREVAMKNEANFRQVARFSYDRPIDEFVDAEALRLLQVPGRDGGQNLLSSASSEVSKFSSEGKK